LGRLAALFGGLALFDELSDALTTLVAEARVAFGTELPFADLAALAAQSGVALGAEFFLAGLATLLANLLVELAAVARFDRLPTLLPQGGIPFSAQFLLARLAPLLAGLAHGHPPRPFAIQFLGHVASPCSRMCQRRGPTPP